MRSRIFICISEC